MKKVILVFLFTFVLFGGEELLFYCGITMVPAIMEAKVQFERLNNCTINIIQGGSKDLYKSIDTSHKGDLFLPGKSSYIQLCKKKEYIIYDNLVGYNRLAIFVRKGNPKHVKGLSDLIRNDLLVTLGNPQTCSIGKAAEETLRRYGGEAFLDKVKFNLSIYAADSRDMNMLLGSGQADMGLNWIAASHTSEAKDKIETIRIEDRYAPPQKLIAAVLSFSSHSETAKAFVRYLASDAGKKIMQKYGFGYE